MAFPEATGDMRTLTPSSSHLQSQVASFYYYWFMATQQIPIDDTIDVNEIITMANIFKVFTLCIPHSILTTVDTTNN